MITLDACANLLDDAPNGLALLRAWNDWREPELVPALEAVRPENIGSALSGMMVLEVLAPDEIIIRLAGSRLQDILGRDLKGRNFVDLAAPSERERRITSYRNYVSYPCGAKWTADVVRASGLLTSVRGLALPVRPRLRSHPMRLYAAFDFTGDLTGFEVDPLRVIPIAHERTYIDLGFGAPE